MSTPNPNLVSQELAEIVTKLGASHDPAALRTDERHQLLALAGDIEEHMYRIATPLADKSLTGPRSRFHYVLGPLAAKKACQARLSAYRLIAAIAGESWDAALMTAIDIQHHMA